MDNARSQGMCDADIAEGSKMIKEEISISRGLLALGPRDYGLCRRRSGILPPLEMELLDTEQRLPKPYPN